MSIDMMNHDEIMMKFPGSVFRHAIQIIDNIHEKPKTMMKMMKMMKTHTRTRARARYIERFPSQIFPKLFYRNSSFSSFSSWFCKKS